MRRPAIPVLLALALQACGSFRQSPHNDAFARALEVQIEADRAADNGDYEGAAQKNRAAIAAYQQAPETAERLNNQAMAKLALENMEGAIADLQRAVDSHTAEWPIFARNLGDAYARLGTWRDAERQYFSILRRLPVERETHAKLLRLYAADAPLEVARALSVAKELAPEGELMIAEGVLAESRFSATASDAVIVLADALARRLPVQTLAESRTHVATSVCSFEPACQQLRDLLTAERRETTSYPWWLNADRPAARRALAHLMQAIGTRAATEGYAHAVAILRDAVAVADPGDLIPAAALIDFYSGAGWPSAYVDEVVRVDGSLTPEGAREYHEAAGVAYVRAGKWYDCASPSRSAVSQLTDARRLGSPTAEAFLRDAPAPPVCQAGTAAPLPPGNPQEPVSQMPPTFHSSPSAGGHDVPFRKTIYFEFDQPSIGGRELPDCVSQLSDIADLLRRNGNARVWLSGYTDDLGDDEYNIRLSVRRAETVRLCLHDRFGIASNRIVDKGYGEADPAAPNIPGHRHENRRVECVISVAKD